MAMTLQERRERAAERKASQARIEAATAEARKIVATGKCPKCGDAIKANLAITGWYVCVQKGAVGFRKDASKPGCEFQCFIAR